MKKMKPIPLRILSVLGVVILLFCSVAMPVFASGSTSDPDNTDVYYSYWNLTKIEVVYADTSETVIFDMPTTFFQTTESYNETVTLTSGSANHTLSLNIIGIGKSDIADPSVGFQFDVKPFSSISFIFEDSVIRCHPFFYTYGKEYSTDLAVPFIQFPDSVDVVSDFEGEAESVYPEYGEEEDDYTFRFTDGAYTFGQFSAEYPYDLPTYALVSQNILDSELEYYRDYVSDDPKYQMPYFPSVRTNIEFDFSAVTSEQYNVSIVLPLGTGVGSSSFNSVRDWYSSYFEEYKSIVYEASEIDLDFSSWITTAVGGFFSFEIFPNLSLGKIMFFVIGVSVVAFFIRFFGG